MNLGKRVLNVFNTIISKKMNENFLSLSDLSDLQKLKNTIANSKLKHNRNKSLTTFSTLLELIRQFCCRSDGEDWKRFLACGVCFINDDLIAVSSSQIKNVLGYTKSNINRLLNESGFKAVEKTYQHQEMLFEKIPYLKNQAFQAKQWSIRQKESSNSNHSLFPNSAAKQTSCCSSCCSSSAPINVSLDLSLSNSSCSKVKELKPEIAKQIQVKENNCCCHSSSSKTLGNANSSPNCSHDPHQTCETETACEGCDSCSKEMDCSCLKCQQKFLFSEHKGMDEKNDAFACPCCHPLFGCTCGIFDLSTLIRPDGTFIKRECRCRFPDSNCDSFSGTCKCCQLEWDS